MIKWSLFAVFALLASASLAADWDVPLREGAISETLA